MPGPIFPALRHSPDRCHLQRLEDGLEGSQAPNLHRRPQEGSSQGRSLSISLLSCPLLSSRQRMRTANLRRVRNNQQTAGKCFVDDGRMLNDGNAAGKVRHKG